MRARLVVFPIRGRNWCFSRSIDHLTTLPNSNSYIPTTLRCLWKKLSLESKSINANAELLVDFFSNKMNKAWVKLEEAPSGTLKNKIHGLGLRLLARVKPSEIFLKSISKEVTGVQVAYPSSLNPRLVRRRLRHIAMRGTIIHRNYLYGSVSLLPLTTAFTVLPLPNIPFFWVLYRTYSHWRALQGSSKLLQLVSNHSTTTKSNTQDLNERRTLHNSLKEDPKSPSLVFQPSEELQRLLYLEEGSQCLSEQTLLSICKSFHLNKLDVLKYKDQM